MNRFFEKAKESGLESCYRVGLQALRGRDKDYVEARDPRKIKGSVYLEECVDGGRWDYIIGYGGNVLFVEIHSAHSKEVKKVLEKLRWLREWKSRTSFANDRQYFWVATKGVKILKRSNYWKMLAQEKLRVVERLYLPPSN